MNAPRHSDVRRRAGASLLVATALALVLHHLATHALPTPPLGHPTQLDAWAREHGTVVVAMTALGLVALAGALYVAAISALALVSSLATAPRALARLAPRITPRLLRTMLGLGVLTTVALPAAPSGARTRTTDVPVLAVVAEREPQDDPPVLEWVEGAVQQPSQPTRSPEPSAQHDASPPASPAAERTWHVRRGDHFWGIAEQVVRERRPDATDAEIARYWRTLIDANRDRLVVPDNADLILPGQQLVVPAYVG